MRQLLWLSLLSSILFCFGLWFTITPQQGNIVFTEERKPSYYQSNNLSTKDTLLKKQIYNQLRIVLSKSKLESLGATLFQDGTLRIQRNIPNAVKLPRTFKHTLSKILPNYFKILSQPHFSQHIEKVYIEAHTSSIWENSSNIEDNFRKNKVLSNQQARAIEGYIYDLIELKYLHRWMELKLVPVGRSFQNLIYVDGKEDATLSRRIELRVEFK